MKAQIVPPPHSQDEVHEALAQVSSLQKRVTRSASPRSKGWWFWASLILGFGALHYLFRLRLIPLPEPYLAPLKRIVMGSMAICLVLLLENLARVFWIGRLSDEISRFNLKRVLRLVAGLVIALIAVSILFANWYTAAVSLGLISLVLGFALQTPISSFIGWIYILIRKPYRVGDRIQIGEAWGDVIDVSYLDTTLWEFGGPHLTTDQPSGRIIKFPNSNVLNTAVFNYSWPLFPYLWNEISFQLAYESDLEFVAQETRRIAEEVVGNSMALHVREYKDLLRNTPVDEMHVQEKPAVYFRVSANTWVEAVVRYLVAPKEAASVKDTLTRKILARLNQTPDRVLMPKSNAR